MYYNNKLLSMQGIHVKTYTCTIIHKLLYDAYRLQSQSINTYCYCCSSITIENEGKIVHSNDVLI